MITLRSDRMRIELSEPGEAPNNGLRFDHAGFISEAVLDGQIRFCASEPRNLRHPSSGGRGLCSEYRCPTWDSVEAGAYFPKFGVGLIRKESEDRYVFYRRYKDVVPFRIRWQNTADEAVFETEPIACAGFALRTVKTVTLAGNTLTMAILAENTGAKALPLEEYCHNFISIDGMATGSDYELELPMGPDLGQDRLNSRAGRPGSLRGKGRGLTFCEFSAIDTDCLIDPAWVTDEMPFRWKLLHRGARASVAGTDGFKPAKIAVWAVDHMVCPEIEHHFCLEPGATHQWTRTWTFDTF